MQYTMRTQIELSFDMTGGKNVKIYNKSYWRYFFTLNFISKWQRVF